MIEEEERGSVTQRTVIICLDKILQDVVCSKRH